MLLPAEKSEHNVPMLALFFCMLLLTSSLFPFEPVTEGKFNTLISVVVSNRTLDAKLIYYNMSYFSKPLPENYPKPGPNDPPDKLPDTFFKPPDPTKPYSQVNFSVKRMNLSNASLYFTVIVNDVTEFKVAGAGGTPICDPATTNENGEAKCTVAYYIDASGASKEIDALETCIIAKVSFKGMSLNGYDFPSSSQSGMICPKGNNASAMLGTVTAGQLSANVWLCFPVIVVISLMIASMYYSGRDPLSLFDITTPRLPKVRQFRVKASTAPQMIRSVLRKYLQMQKKMESDATKAMLMAVRVRAKKEGFSREKTADELRKAKGEVRAIFADLGKALKDAKRPTPGLTDKELSDLTRRLDTLFQKHKPGGDKNSREFRLWAKHYEAVTPFIQLYNATHQAMLSTKEGRGGTKNWFTRKISNPVFDKLTDASISTETNRAMRFLGRVPILKTIVNTPTKTLDAIAQYRASRSGAIVLRREIMGGVAHSIMRATKTTDSARKLFDPNKVIGKFFKWSYKWDFNDYEKRHDVRNRKFKELYDPVANTRKLSIELQNTMFAKLLSQLELSLPTRKNFQELITALRQQVDDAGFRIGKDKIYQIIKATHGEAAAEEFRKTYDRNPSHFKELIKRLEALSSKIDAMKSGAKMDKYLNEYNRILKENPWLAGEMKFSAAQWQNWEHWEKELGKIAGKNYATQADRLDALYKVAKEAGTADKSGITQLDIASFRNHEIKVMRAILLARMENDLYKEISWDSIRNEKRNLLNSGHSDLAADQMLRDKYWEKYRIDVSTEAAFNRRMEVMRSRLISNLDLGVTQLLRIRDVINDRVRARMEHEINGVTLPVGGRNITINIPMGGRTDSFAMLQYNMAGTNAAGDILTRKLRELGIDITVRDARELELRFLKGTMAGENYAKVDAAAKRLGLSADTLVKKMIADTEMALLRYNIQNQKTADIFFGSAAERKKALADITGNVAKKELYMWMKLEEQAEYSVQRVKFGYASYDLGLETHMNLLRAMERAAGFVVWGKREGGSWGDSTLGLLNSLREHNRESLGILKAFYNNLKNGDSKFYDSSFAAGSSFEEAYLRLRDRGYNFQDMRNGLGFMVSGDRRGGLPFLEHDKDVLAAYKYSTDGIVRKSEVRDISALLARMADSPYINLPSGVSILIKHEKAGSISWMYGDPLKSQSVRELYQLAGRDVKDAVSISNQLAGYDPKTKTYNSDNQKIKIIATRDLREIKSNPGSIFGNVSTIDRIKATARNITHGIGLAVGETYYSSTNFRATQMEKWYASQYQVRQALDAYEHAMKRGMTGGKDRLAKMPYEKDPEDREKYASDNLSSHSMLARGEINDAVYHDRLNKIEAMQKGDGSFTGTLSATWNQFKRNIFAKTATEISDAENKLYAAKFELRAIEKQHSEKMIDDREYAWQKSIVQAELQTRKAEYSGAKADYKDYNSIARFWSSSHDNVYGSRYNIFGTGILGKIFDSSFQQGAKLDYYWITESGAMRDPRTATGAGFGLDYAFYVGYQTGQTVYERNRFYGTNAMWEQQMRYPLNLSLVMHKWFNPMVSQALRDTSHYPSVYEMDALYPGQPHASGQKGSKHDLIMPMILAPFRRHYSSDFWRTRLQYAFDQSGLSSLIGAYQSTETGGEPGMFRRGVDKLFADSSGHYATEARFIANQRMLDRVNRMDKILDKYDDAKEAYEAYTDSAATSEERKEALKTLGKYIDMVDRRPLGVQRGVSGSDMDEDGSRNRFMNLYIGFHENIWKPTVPGMQDVDPITGRWKAFSQIASVINRGEEGSRLDNLKSFNIGKVNDDGVMEYRDQFSTASDALRETYKRESTGLLHLMKYQNEMLGYSFPNAPSIIMLNPGFWGAIYYGRNLLRNSKWGASFAGVESDGEYGNTNVPHNYNPFPGAYGRLAYNGNIIKNNIYNTRDSIQGFFGAGELARQNEEMLANAIETRKFLGKDIGLNKKSKGKAP